MAKAAKAPAAPEEGDAKQTRHRSPNYPYFDLPTAIEKTRMLFKAIGRHPVGVPVVISKLGYTAKSSSGKKALAALRAFGFIDDTKANGDALVKLSDRALDIVADFSEGSPEWREAVGKAARSPKIHAAILTHYGGTLPLEEELKRYLVRVYKPAFSDAGASEFIAEIRSTLAFAERHGQAVDTSENGSDPEAPDNTEVRVGSYVQWTSQGIDRFEVPLKVAKIMDGPDGKKYAFLEGPHQGAIAVSQLSVQDPPASAGEPFDFGANPFYKPIPQKSDSEEPKPGVARDRGTFDEGPVLLEYPDELSEESVEEFQYWIIGRLNRIRRKAQLPPVSLVEPKPTATSAAEDE